MTTLFRRRSPLQAGSQGPRKSWRRYGGAALVSLLTLSSAAAIEPAANCFFAEPFTGRRVTEYLVDLSTGRADRQSYSIPGQCPDVITALQEGAAFKGSIVDRRLWQKVEADCRYYDFLHRHPLREVVDYVSGYDFMNARLSDLPITQGCAGGDQGAGDAGCSSWAADGLSLIWQFPFADPREAGDSAPLQEECALRNGLFFGRLFVDADGIRCEAQASAPSLRLIGVDFADINGDQVLDAVLRFVPVGPGAARSPLILPLTRSGPDEPFRIPEPRGAVEPEPVATE